MNKIDIEDEEKKEFLEGPNRITFGETTEEDYEFNI